MANFIDGTYVANGITTATYNGMTDNATVAVVNQMLAAADATVVQALTRAGYPGISPTVPPANAIDAVFVKELALLAFVIAGLARRNVQINAAFWAGRPNVEDFMQGKFRLPVQDPDQLGTPGGAQITNSGTAADTSTPRDARLTPDKLENFP